MLKVLIKKQILELFSLMFTGSQASKKKKKRKKAKSVVRPGMIFLAIFLILLLMLACGAMAAPMAIFILPTSGAWLYYSIFAILGFVVSLFINVFIASSMLYKAKDNDLLLSLPIPTSSIIISRMVILLINCFIVFAIVWIPAIVVAIICSQISIIAIICCMVLFIVLSIFSMVFSSIIGWFIALITRNKNTKTILTIIFSVVLILAVVGSRFVINDAIKNLIENINEISAQVAASCYPMYILGHAASGNIVYTLLISLAVLVLFAAVCFVISKTFLTIVSSAKGTKKHNTKFKYQKSRGVLTSIFRKDLSLLFKTPTYFVNCGIGAIFIFVIIFLFMTQSKMMESFLEMNANIPEFVNVVPGIIVAIICFTTGFNCITTPSISLEGKNIWILKSLPIRPFDIFVGKSMLHIVFNTIPAFIATLILAIIFSVSVINVIAVMIYILMFSTLTAFFGMCVGIKRANLTWTNITIPIKQNLGVGFAILFTVGVTLGSSIIYVLLFIFLPAFAILLVLSVILFLFNMLFVSWFKHTGTKLFNQL